MVESQTLVALPEVDRQLELGHPDQLSGVAAGRHLADLAALPRVRRVLHPPLLGFCGLASNDAVVLEPELDVSESHVGDVAQILDCAAAVPAVLEIVKRSSYS